jgi:hypothetical protein
MDALRVIRVPLAMIVAALVMTAFLDATAGLIWLAASVALAVAKWAAWRYYPRLRFRIWPRMRP